MRVGLGYDVHAFRDGRCLILGGVDIPFEKGLDGHSDADVLVHALMDSMLGAANLGDIGTHFPDDDERYRGADSIMLLAKTAQLVREAGYSFVNADCVIVAQRPKLKEYIPQMGINMAEAIGCPPEDVSVKATTEEWLGFTGDMSGIKAYAVCLLEKQTSRGNDSAEDLIQKMKTNQKGGR
ncbi:MAG: 2-C-methyl-D-erythritol 2,4-cyclodiphosphate synthase [Eubacteriaceae bacterium]|nr:2-C-methyl-D-erythritol 2,4-cyclodiphosphate synthase [Eubacteriaceae bacterium]